MFSSASSALSALKDLIFLKIKFLNLLLDPKTAIKISPPTKMIPICVDVDNDVVVGVAVGVVAVVVVVVAIVVVLIKAFVVKIMT